MKNYAKTHPHRMGAWVPESKTNVATMGADDFRSTEKSAVIAADGTLRIEFVGADGETTVLRESIPVLADEVVDSSVLHVAALDEFLTTQIARAKAEGVMFSVHLKATMMKVSDPIVFGHVVRAFFPKTFEQYGETLAAAGLSPNDGLGGIYNGLAALPEGDAIKASFDAELADGPALAMVDSDKGITNLHVPSDVIVDASMPAMIRTSGHMWGADGQEHDTLAVLPDSSYAGIYQVVLDDCRAHGAFDPATMGSVPNVGLMAQKAEEYGSHDKTFELPAAGTVRLVDADGNVVLEQEVAAGDIFRACQTKDAPIRDWVKLAVTRARATGDPAVFWLDETRAHDAQLISKVTQYLTEYDTEGLDIKILAPVEAIRFSLDRIRRGENTISVTGNVLRDYLTDLFPILELGTSAKMLSVVPLMAGGGLFETGAGGSAPKHVQQLVKENYLRWDSLGEFFALAASFEHLAQTTDNARAQVLADPFDDPVDLAGRAEDEARLDRLDGVLADHRRRRFELDAGEPRGALHQRCRGDLETGGDHSAEELAVLGDDVEVGAGAEVDHDRGAAEARVGRERIDDPVGSDLARIVGEDRDAGLRPRTHHQRLEREIPSGHLAELLRDVGHDRRDAQAGELLERQPSMLEQSAEDERELVRGALRLGGEPPCVREL